MRSYSWPAMGESPAQLDFEASVARCEVKNPPLEKPEAKSADGEKNALAKLQTVELEQCHR